MVWTWCSNSTWQRPRLFHLGCTGDLPVVSLPSTVCSCRRIAGSRHRGQAAPRSHFSVEQTLRPALLPWLMTCHPTRWCAPPKQGTPRKRDTPVQELWTNTQTIRGSVCRHPERSQPRVKEWGGIQERFSKKNQETNSVAVIKPVKKYTVLVTVLATVTK